MSRLNELDAQAGESLRAAVSAQTKWHMETFGDYASAHEAYGVILAAFEKSQEITKLLKKDLERYWDGVKSGDDTAFRKNSMNVMESARYLAQEATILAGCCEKLTPDVNNRNAGGAQESGPERQTEMK